MSLSFVGYRPSREAVVRRREFISVLGGAAAAWPCIVRAQQETHIPRIGVLSPSRSEDASPNRVTLKSFLAGLRELGYIDGQNITIERVLSEANADYFAKPLPNW
jgi:hypothetical protein